MMGGFSMCKIRSCGVCCLRVKTMSVLCVICGRWFHGKWAKVKMVIVRFSRFAYS